MLTYDLGDGAELRDLEPWQAEEFAEHVARARDHLRPWLPWSSQVVDVESARRRLRDHVEDRARDTARWYGIWLDGGLVGGIAFVHFDVKRRVCEIGAWLEPAAEGRGLVTRSAVRLMGWAFGSRGMNRVEWRVVTSNLPSIAVAERLGMTYEGTLRQVFPGIDDLQDVEVWAMLAEEWVIRTRPVRT